MKLKFHLTSSPTCVHTCTLTALLKYIYTKRWSGVGKWVRQSADTPLPPSFPHSSPHHHFLFSLQIYNSVGVFKSSFFEQTQLRGKRNSDCMRDTREKKKKKGLAGRQGWPVVCTCMWACLSPRWWRALRRMRTLIRTHCPSIRHKRCSVIFLCHCGFKKNYRPQLASCGRTKWVRHFCYWDHSAKARARQEVHTVAHFNYLTTYRESLTNTNKQRLLNHYLFISMLIYIVVDKYSRIWAVFLFYH